MSRAPVTKLLVLAFTSLLFALAVTPREADASAEGAMSWVIVASDEGLSSNQAPLSRGGGSLFADGTAIGRGTITRGAQAQVIQPMSWRWIDAGRTIDICFTTEAVDGEPFLPQYFCLSTAEGFALPVGGVPVTVDLYGSDVRLQATS